MLTLLILGSNWEFILFVNIKTKNGGKLTEFFTRNYRCVFTSAIAIIFLNNNSGEASTEHGNTA
jgi:hypothetical protein